MIRPAGLAIHILVCVELALQGFYYVVAGDFLFNRVGLAIYAPELHAGFANRPGLDYTHRTNEFQARYIVNRSGFRVPDPATEYASLRQPVLVAYFPLSYAIHPDDVARWRHLGVTDVPRQLAFDAAFVRHLNANGTEAIDLTPSFLESAASGDRLYYWLDIHWTPAGNRVAASAIARHLAQHR